MNEKMNNNRDKILNKKVKDPHQNIFYYYRGPSKRKSSEDFDKQIENNTTKALINVLEFSKDNELLKDFLRECGIKIDYVEKSRFKLQIREKESIPDAFIEIGSKKILIETKVDAELSKDQIKRHLEDLNGSGFLLIIKKTEENEKCLDIDKRIREITWEDIFEFFEKRKKTFLIEQFLEYLESIGLSQFRGFNEMDFLYFEKGFLEYVPFSKRKLEKLGELIRNSKDKLNFEIIKSRVGNVRRKNKKEGDRIWMALKTSVPKKFKNCNVSIELDEKGILINLVIRDGKIINDKKPIGIFLKKVSEDKDFLEKIKHSNSIISIFKREPNNYTKDDKPLFRGGERWNKLIKRFESNKNNLDKKFKTVLKDENIFYGIQIGTLISKDDPILRNKDKLLEKITDKMNKYFPILDSLIKR